MINSRAKGKAGELELSHVLKAMGHKSARRGQQFSGGKDSPDVIAIPGVHIEAKRVQSLNLKAAMDQAISDGGANVPSVIHRKNHSPWLLTLKLEDFERFAECWNKSKMILDNP